MVFEYTSSHFPETVRISVREESSVVAAAGSYSFDREGRLVTASRDDRFYKRGLNHRVLEKLRTPAAAGHGYARRDLDADETDTLISDVLAEVRSVLRDLPADAPSDVRDRVRQVAAWSPEAYREDADRFRAIYKPVGILPPDQYQSLVLQATEGCHHNQCTFCHFYDDIPFRIKSPEEFSEHVEAVRRFLGRSLALRRSVFLADANALVVSQRRLLPLLDVLHRPFEFAPPDLPASYLSRWKARHPFGLTGIYSFIDAFTGRKKSVQDFRELAALGLRRVYIGMESGHEPLLDFLHKPSKPADVRDLTTAARTAGVNAAVIVMVGIGGQAYAQAHVDETARVINDLNLGSGDIVYLSEFVDTPGSVYDVLAGQAGIGRLSRVEVAAQGQALRARLRLAPGVKVAVYDIREFVY